MLLLLLEEGTRVDEIVFIDTGLEFKEMYKHLEDVEKYIGREITRLSAEHSFEYFAFEHLKTKGKNQGTRGYGLPSFACRWCTRALKLNPKNKYLKQFETYTEFVGFAADETARLEKANNKTASFRFPLIEKGLNEKQALDYCYSKGFTWGGLYEKFNRLSCWCCPFQRLGELEVLYRDFPDYWKKLKEYDSKAFNTFRYDYTLQELEIKFLYPELFKTLRRLQRRRRYCD
jgi:3'-phosphoadenosine 5'-phosphosulfate sulfotransferase (PAPS reductase)/FAD synthetase